MERLAQFVEFLFSDLPPGEARDLAREAVYQRLAADYQDRLEEGAAPADALNETLLFFGLQEAAEREYLHQKLACRYRAFRKRYPLLLIVGFAGILVIPLLFLFFSPGIESKLASLAGWIFSMILLITFIICVEYWDYRSRKLLKSFGPKEAEAAPMEEPASADGETEPKSNEPFQETSADGESSNDR